MALYDIGAKLKEWRKNKGYTAKKVVEILKERGREISIFTLYTYENGKNMPNADIFIDLCRIYDIEDIYAAVDVDYEDTDKTKDANTDTRELVIKSLTEKEMNIILQYRFKQQCVKDLVDKTLNLPLNEVTV